CPLMATQSESEAHETAWSGKEPSDTPLQAAIPPVGSTDEYTLPPAVTATQNVAVGQETPEIAGVPARGRRVQAERSPDGADETSRPPCMSPATHKLVVGQDMDEMRG